MNLRLYILLLSIATSFSFSQIGINNSNPDGSSVLDLKSNTSGFLVPRLTSDQRLNVLDPANSLLVFDVDERMMFFYDSLYNSGSSNWTGLSPWLFRDVLDDFDPVNQFYKRDLIIHPSINQVSIGTETPFSGNEFTVVGNVAIGDSTTAAPTNGLYLKEELEAQSSVTVANTVEADEFTGIGVMPVGGIIMWSGELNDLPSEWALCDGSVVNGYATPDLSGKFVVGYNASGGTSPTVATNKEVNTGVVGNTGGTDLQTLETENLPIHNHGGSTNDGGNHRHSFTDRYWSIARNNDWSIDEKSQGREDVRDNDSRDTEMQGTDHSHTISDTGEDESHENRPRYYVLAFIIRVE